MELEHRFEIPVGIDTAWEALLDMERVAACFPGAHLDRVDGDDFSGSLTVKLGRRPLTIHGSGRIADRDPATHRARLEASGTSAKDESNAAVLVSMTATPLTLGRTAVDLVTTLSITGRPARLGRAAMVAVGNESISRFADCLARELTGRPAGGAELVDVVNPDDVAAEMAAGTSTVEATPSAPPSVGVRRVVGGAQPVDALQAAGVPLLRKALPAVLGVVALVLLRKIFSRRTRDRDDD
ncbi:SRPBCC family protein [Nakamurella endophytica]|uniref:Carbon monoxide dehydrogenase n=1 Tax=Nakamurella endophytica TaxID=1748367 RepID=A0A917WDS7_9ACTN|nr:SRPBCC family protein [Nakamurella endophytica]GGL96115.1 hypothetical protein GCM10011594_14790 [Nakamurella endophytica]